ncbi:TetR family transcriptional regulator [Brasilonema bromeliae SPC951]|uniref:TetR family transcriptional regulator n=2 Tax=Bromeliae group (in: Brasilonema) TaxID=3398495 RepID=A0ABX1PA26_9CYAN|nr:TetR family transcriptional regulator [Brasilonema bromeliae SPC951]
MEVGYAQLTIEGVAARAGVGKPTIYRRWSTKARLIIDAFLAATNPELSFPDTGSVKEDILQQMHKLVKVINSPRGQVIATLIGGGQTDPEMIEAFRANWLSPRRFDCSQVIKKGIERGELRSDVDMEAVIDALYSPLFYRLLLKHAPLTEDFVDQLIDVVMSGLNDRLAISNNEEPTKRK